MHSKQPDSVIEFMNDIRNEFDVFEFRATGKVAIVTSTGWPAHKHPVNEPDSRFVVPMANHNPQGDV